MENNSTNECPEPKGILLIIGGKEDKGSGSPDTKETPDGTMPEEVLKTFIKLIEKEDPILEVVTTASSEGEGSFKDYQKLFHELGVQKVGHIHHMSREEVLKEPLEERVNQADALFFSGGDQLKLTSIYGGTSFLTHLKEKYISE